MSKTSMPYIETRDVGDVTIVKIFAPPNKKLMEEQEIQWLWERHLLPFVEAPDKTKLALDLSEIEYMSSAARGKMISLYKKVTAKNGRLVTFGATGHVLEVFHITKMDRTLALVESEQAALQELAKPMEAPKPQPPQPESKPLSDDQMKLACAKRLLQLAGSPEKAKAAIDQVASVQ